MKHQILKNIGLTFLLSILLTGLMFAIWFGSQKRGFEEGQALTLLMFVGDIFQNLILANSSLLALQLVNKGLFLNKKHRLIGYFGGPIILTVGFLAFSGKNSVDYLTFLLPGISFLSIHTYFYFRLVEFGERFFIDNY